MSRNGVRSLLDEAGARPPESSDPGIDGLSPALVLEPDDEETCARALSLCHRENMAVVPVGAATRLYVGNAPSRLDVYLVTRGLEGIEDHAPGDLTVAVRAGTRLASLQEALAPAGQFLPVDPPRAPKATVGGIFALGEPGFRRRPGARPRDLLLGFEAILADGTPVRSGGRVVKNVSGYELGKLLVGSAGTLAVMTRVFVRLRALPEETLTLAVEYRRASQAFQSWSQLVHLPQAPEAAALVNPSFARRYGLDDWTLFVRFEGFRQEVRKAAEAATTTLSARLHDEVPKDVWTSLRDFPVSDGDGLTLRGQAAPARSFELAERWRDGGALVAFPDGGLVYSLTEDPDALTDRQEAAKLLGANVVVERASSELKKEIDVYGERPEGFAIMERIKQKLDPTGILSPGRFVGRL